MTYDEAKTICKIVPIEAYTRSSGYGSTSCSEFANDLRRAFPDFNWRIILDRSGRWSQWALTVDDNDPREHYVSRNSWGPGVCVHCGKMASELGIEERED